MEPILFLNCLKLHELIINMEEKRLTRSFKDRMIAGVCGGLADYFKLDPSLVRIGVVLICLVTAVVPVFLIYCILWVVIPQSRQ